MGLSFFKEFADSAFAFSIKLPHDLRTGDIDKIGVSFMGHSSYDESFSCARGAIKEYSFGWLNPEAFKDFRVFQRKFNHLPDTLNLVAQSSDIFIRDLSFGFAFLFCQFKLKNRIWVYQYYSLRIDACYSIINRA